MSQFDPDKFKQEQKARWNQGARSTWTLWKQTQVEDTPAKFFLGLVPIRPGVKVLDLACGSGETSLQVAQLVSSHLPSDSKDAKIVCVDISEEMLRVLSQRAQELGLSSVVETCCEDAENINFGTHYFDMVMSQFGVMFLPHLPEDLANIRKMMKPGSLFCCVVWGEEKDCHIFYAARSVVSPPPPPPGTPVSYGTKEKVMEALRKAEFSDVKAVEFQVVHETKDAEEYITLMSGVNQWLEKSLVIALVVALCSFPMFV
ncbi:hypothetical protein Gasu2_41510 [Galdieria sulphuraria]|nr:hypothetical protein Gasu2_41510 [Galdieria sulphuraria]